MDLTVLASAPSTSRWRRKDMGCDMETQAFPPPPGGADTPQSERPLSGRMCQAVCLRLQRPPAPPTDPDKRDPTPSPRPPGPTLRSASLTVSCSSPGPETGQDRQSHLGTSEDCPPPSPRLCLPPSSLPGSLSKVISVLPQRCPRTRALPREGGDVWMIVSFWPC